MALDFGMGTEIFISVVCSSSVVNYNTLRLNKYMYVDAYPVMAEDAGHPLALKRLASYSPVRDVTLCKPAERTQRVM